ncbi:MAG: TIGR03936 family radical SAM-associated protein [Oscillospiraceae bacterium]
MDKKQVRASFTKTDRAVYISHLDLLRTMQRALKRAHIPAWYSEGFNPRIYLSFPLALSVGIVGKHEFMDFFITEEMSFDEIKDRLNGVLPEGLHIIEVHSPVNEAKDIFGAEYLIKMHGKDIAGHFEEFVSSDRIDVKKHSRKKGEIVLDIKPYTEILSKTVNGDELTAEIRLPAGNELNINPSLLLDAFAERCGEPEKIYVERTKILCDMGADFV